MGVVGKYDRGRTKESLGGGEFRCTNEMHQLHFRDGKGRGSEKLSNIPNST